MKSMTKLMVVAMLLVAALVVAPAAAARTISTSGANVFVGEEDITFTGEFTGTTKLVHYTGKVAESSIDETITLVTGKVEEFRKGIPTGSYYAIGSADPTATYVNVQNPEVTLDVMIDATPLKDSVDGKSVTRDTKLAFKIRSNVDTYVPGTYVNDNVSIELTLPGGGTVTEFGGKTLVYHANGSTQEIRPISLEKAAAGTYTAVGKWARSSDFFGKGFDSKPVTFEVLTKALAITANKDSVVRGNSFTVTIAGESREDYRLSVKSPLATLKENPLIAPGQTAVNYTVPAETDISRTVKTNAGGTATIQFNTTQDTEEKTFTIRVEASDPSKNDEVKVRVEAGSVTVTASGTGTYYIGEEITLSGTCTEGDKVYFFMTGPNLDSDGVNLTRLQAVDPANSNTFESADVETDDTWSKKWNTADLMATYGISIDAGGYTIYAVSDHVNKKGLPDAKYATTSINLRSGFISGTTSGATVAKGDELKITGNAEGDQGDVYIWIFGKNYYGRPSELYVRPVSVESDGSFEEKLKSAITKDLAAGQYFVVIQHPMGATVGNAGSITWTPTGSISGGGMNPVRLTGLQAPAAASALINLLDSPNIPDTYVKLTFVVDEPVITIDPIGTKEAGSKFTITGTTNLAVGGTLNVEVTSAAFQPGAKTEASAFSGTGGSAIIEKGDGTNKWSFEVDATEFKPDEYIVNVEHIESDKTATALFDMVEATETTPPVGEVTTPPAGEVTTPPADETPAEPTTPPTPGFGALVALAGLGAVAFLVLRRK